MTLPLGFEEHPVAPTPVDKYETLSTVELCAKIKEPTTSLELMANFKFAMDNDLLLRDDFYEKDELSAVFGGKEIFVRHPKTDAQEFTFKASLINFPKIYPPILMRNVIRSGFEILIDVKYKNGIPTEGWLRALWSRFDGELVYENVINVLGTPNRFEIEESEPRGPIAPITHPYGHMSMSYDYKTSKMTRYIGFSLTSQGTLALGSFKATCHS